MQNIRVVSTTPGLKCSLRVFFTSTNTMLLSHTSNPKMDIGFPVAFQSESVTKLWITVYQNTNVSQIFHNLPLVILSASRTSVTCKLCNSIRVLDSLFRCQRRGTKEGETALTTMNLTIFLTVHLDRIRK